MNQVTPRIDKGKQRAVVDFEEPCESTPLLGSSSQQPGLVTLEAEPQDRWEIDWPTVIKSLLYGALLTLIIILGLLAYAASRLRRDITLDEAVRWELTGLRIVNVSTGGEDSSPSISAEVQALIQGVDLGYLSDWERKLASWGIRTVDTVRVSSAPVQAKIRTASGLEDVAAVTVKPFDLKLPPGPENKEPVTFIAYVQPTVNASRAINLLEYAWSEQEVNAEALVTDIRVEGIQGGRQWIKVDLDIFKLPLSYERESFWVQYLKLALITRIKSQIYLSSHHHPHLCSPHWCQQSILLTLKSIQIIQSAQLPRSLTPSHSSTYRISHSH
jgi:hypothetical protein